MTSTARPPLDVQRVYQAWRADVDQHGKRGAYRRVAARYNVSGERIRQIVQAQQPYPSYTGATQPLKDDSITYTPPPFAYPAPQPRPQADPLLSQLVLAEIMSPSTETASGDGDEWQASEPACVLLPESHLANARPYRASPFVALPPHDFRRDYDISATWGMLQAAILTELAIAGGRKDVRLGLMLLPVALGAWHIAAQWCRQARRMQ
jgi:hypothetical protein